MKRFVRMTLGIAILYAAAFGVRYAVLRYHRNRMPGGRLPYTLEGALQFHYAERVAEGRALPEIDPDAQWPEGLPVRRALSTGPMELTGRIHRLVGRPAEAFHEDVRLLAIGFASLGAVAVFLWALALGVPAGWAGLAGALYAVMPSAVIRSSGIEFMGEHYGLPFFFFHTAFLASALEKDERDAGGRTEAWAAAVCLLIGLWLWDLVQIGPYLLAGWLWIQRFLRPDERISPGIVLPQAAAVVAAGCTTAYGRAHGLAFSLPVILTAAWALDSMAGTARPAGGRRRSLAILVAGVALGAGPAALFPYEGAYGHFGRLLWAKLRFLNRKPADPSRLSFDARILWVPALHSATLGLTMRLFPATLLSTATARWVVWVRRRSRRERSSRRFAFFLFWSFVFLYVLMVRFHVFLAGASAVVAVVVMQGIRGRNPGWRWPVRMWGAALLILESFQTIGLMPWMGRDFAYYGELEDLVTIVREQTPPDAVVLGNFGLEPSLLHYGRRRIVLHPKFESPGLRRKVERYAGALFAGTEEDFRRFCDEAGAGWYVYSLGEFSMEEPRHSLRYCAGVLNPGPESAARRMEYDPRGLRWFRLAAQNRKYRLFEVIGAERARRARDLLDRAEVLFREGRLEEAYERATDAAEADPGLTAAFELIGRISRLYEAGFGRPLPASAAGGAER